MNLEENQKGEFLKNITNPNTKAEYLKNLGSGIKKSSRHRKSKSVFCRTCNLAITNQEFYNNHSRHNVDDNYSSVYDRNNEMMVIIKIKLFKMLNKAYK